MHSASFFSSPQFAALIANLQQPFADPDTPVFEDWDRPEPVTSDAPEPRRRPRNGHAHPKVSTGPEKAASARPGPAAMPSQAEFLAALAAGMPEGLHFHVAQLQRGGGFHNHTWTGQTLVGPWYFHTGASRSRKHRRGSDIGAVRALVLGDIGTKSKASKADPSWIMETSPGNFQHGFLLDWCTDFDGIAALNTACRRAGLQDAGETGFARLNRIPGSINVKPTLAEPFTSRLVEWNPQRVYTLQALTEALGVTIEKADRPAVAISLAAADEPDALLSWLGSRNMVTGRGSDGFLIIECPFSEEHSDGRNDAKYKPLAKGGCVIGCMHSHGGMGGDDEAVKAAYRARFLEWVRDQGGPLPGDMPPEFLQALKARRDDGARPMIEWPESKVAKIERERQAALASEGPFTCTTLRAALGDIRKAALPDVELRENATGKRNPKALQPCTLANVEAGLQQLHVLPRMSVMDMTIEYTLPACIGPERFAGMDSQQAETLVVNALCDAFTRCGIKERSAVRNCLRDVADQHRYHPMEDWARKTPWDGQDRFEPLLASVTPASEQDAQMLRLYLRRWLIQTAECFAGWRVRPDSQKGLTLIFSGPQYIGKTTWFQRLAPGFTKLGVHIALNGSNARDSQHEALKNTIVELGEIETTFGKSEHGALKAFLTRTRDEYRLPYASTWANRPRCTSFAGTVNSDDFLRDPTGARRWGAVAVTHLDLNHGIDMQQLWAQVLTWWAAGEQWWLTDAEKTLQTDSNERFQQADTIAEAVAESLGYREAHPDMYPLECAVSVSSMAKLLNLHWEHPAIARSVSTAMHKHLGKPRDLRHRGGGQRCWALHLHRNEQEAIAAALLTAP